MNHPDLMKLVEAHETAEFLLKASSQAVWSELVNVEPELAADILRLFATPEAAALWVTSSFGELGGSPARRAAEGRAATIMSIVRKTDHGFVG
jgi:hypothetical protein